MLLHTWYGCSLAVVVFASGFIAENITPKETRRSRPLQSPRAFWCLWCMDKHIQQLQCVQPISIMRGGNQQDQFASPTVKSSTQMYTVQSFCLQLDLFGREPRAFEPCEKGQYSTLSFLITFHFCKLSCVGFFFLQMYIYGGIVWRDCWMEVFARRVDQHHSDLLLRGLHCLRWVQSFARLGSNCHPRGCDAEPRVLWLRAKE